MVKLYGGFELDRLKEKVVKVQLTKPLSLVRDNESFFLSEVFETADLKRIPTIREIVGYITRYRIVGCPSDTGFISVNPFGSDGIISNEEGRRAGDVFINLRYVDRLEKII